MGLQLGRRAHGAGWEGAERHAGDVTAVVADGLPRLWQSICVEGAREGARAGIRAGAREGAGEGASEGADGGAGSLQSMGHIEMDALLAAQMMAQDVGGVAEQGD